MARAAQEASDAQELLERVCRIACAELGFARVSIARYDDEHRTLIHAASHGIRPELLPALPAIDESPLHKRALEERRLIYVADAPEAAGPLAEAARRLGVTSAILVPLMSLGRCLGFLGADRGGRPFELDDATEAGLEAVAVLTATFLEKATVQDEMRRVEAVKDQFIALASHELKTPAAVIYGITATLHARGNELTTQQLVELRATLHGQSERLKNLVEQLLDVSRLDAGAASVAPVPTHVRRRIEELVLLLAERRANEVALDVDPELQADVDPAAFDRILSNLITNALRYGAPPIRIEAAQKDRHFRVVLEDRGHGIQPSLAARVFERFTRGDEATGTGLGLAIARSYALAHGGDLLYRSADPHGARFELVIPQERRPH